MINSAAGKNSPVPIGQLPILSGSDSAEGPKLETQGTPVAKGRQSEQAVRGGDRVDGGWGVARWAGAMGRAVCSVRGAGGCARRGSEAWSDERRRHTAVLGGHLRLSIDILTCAIELGFRKCRPIHVPRLWVGRSYGIVGMGIGGVRLDRVSTAMGGVDG